MDNPDSNQAEPPSNQQIAMAEEKTLDSNYSLVFVSDQEVQLRSAAMDVGVLKPASYDHKCKCCGGPKEYIIRLVNSNEKLGPHRVWQAWLDHLRQPGNCINTYWFFRRCISKKCFCSPYQEDACQHRPVRDAVGNLLSCIVGAQAVQNHGGTLDSTALRNLAILQKSHYVGPGVDNLWNLLFKNRARNEELNKPDEIFPTRFTALTEASERCDTVAEVYKMCAADSKASSDREIDKPNEQPLEGNASIVEIFKAENPIFGCSSEIKRSPKASDAAEQATSMAGKIFEHYDHLHRFVLMHEAILQQAWLGKGQKQRRTLLKEAANLHRDGLWDSSKLNGYHRSDLATSLFGCKNMPDDPLRVPEFACPHLNLDDLTEGNNLLLFIKSRGRHLPGVFSKQDLDGCASVMRQMHVKRLDKAGIPHTGTDCKSYHPSSIPEVPGYLMKLTDAITVEQYSQFYTDTGVSIADYMPVDEGLSTLTIQLWTYSFLHRVCVALLCQVFDVSLKLAWEKQADWLDIRKHTEQPEPSLPGVPEALPSVPAMLKVAAYNVPMTIDLELLGSLISARASEAQDDVQSARCDPGFFQDLVKAESDNSPLHTRDHTGNVSEDVKDGKGSQFYWMKVLETVIRNTHLDLAIWKALLSHVDRLKTLWPSGTAANNLPLSLLPELHKNLSQLCCLLRIAIDYASKETFFASTACYRHVYKLHDSIGLCSHEPRSWDENLPGSKLGYTFHCLGLDSAGDRHASDWVFADFVQGLIDNNPSESKYMSSLLRGRFNDWALLCEIDRQLRGLHNWSEEIQAGCMLVIDDFKHDLGVLHRFNKVAYGAAQQVAEANFLGRERFKYPIHGAKTRNVIEKRRESEAELHNFWQKVDNFCETYFAPIEELLGIEIMQDVVPMSTPPWKEPEVLTKTVLNPPRVAVDVWDLELRTRLKIDDDGDLTSRDKIKTHGDSALNPEQVVSPHESIHQADDSGPANGSIKLGKKAYRTLTTLFHSAEEHAQRPREVIWTDFAYAMVAAGFTVNRLWGSAWHFRPIDQSMGRSIQFHEPHPSHKLDVNLCRHTGRRLNRAFGWTFETFARKDGTERA